MKRHMKQTKQVQKPMRRRLAVLLVCTLILTMLPMRNPTASQAAGSAAEKAASDSTQNARAGYGLSNPTTDAAGVTTWDTVYFGSYWQNDTNGDGKANQDDEKEPIKWRVLSVDGDDAFLLADENLDCQPYNDTYTGVTWETCTLRSWLNSTFLNNAFTAAEQSAIRQTPVENPDNPEYGTEGGNDTTDRVYLLSIEEAANSAYGFLSTIDSDSKTRGALNTAYTKEKGAGKASDQEYYGNGFWWLRSLGQYIDYASYISTRGNIKEGGTAVYFSQYSVRPALYLNLSSDSGWSYGGTVNSEGIAIGPVETAEPGPFPSSAPMETERPNATKNPFQTEEPSVSSLKAPRTYDGVTTWDTVYFGSYWQNDTNGDGMADKYDDKEPIRWRVLSVDGDDVFLLADRNIDCQAYNDTNTDVTWESSTMRSWLNSTFLNNAFTSAQQTVIYETTIANPGNSVHGTAGGSDTVDQVYLLSVEEAVNPAYGFARLTENSGTRLAKNTAYVADGGEADGSMYDEGEPDVWWLRSPGSSAGRAVCIRASGAVDFSGNTVDDVDYAVRPALHLNLSSDSGWSYAGTVNSEGTEEQEPSPAPTATLTPTAPPTTPPTASPESTTGPSMRPDNPSAKPTATSKPTATARPSTAPGVTEKPTDRPSATEEPYIALTYSDGYKNEENINGGRLEVPEKIEFLDGNGYPPQPINILEWGKVVVKIQAEEPIEGDGSWYGKVALNSTDSDYTGLSAYDDGFGPVKYLEEMPFRTDAYPDGYIITFNIPEDIDKETWTPEEISRYLDCISIQLADSDEYRKLAVREIDFVGKQDYVPTWGGETPTPRPTATPISTRMPELTPTQTPELTPTQEPDPTPTGQPGQDPVPTVQPSTDPGSPTLTPPAGVATPDTPGNTGQTPASPEKNSEPDDDDEYDDDDDDEDTVRGGKSTKPKAGTIMTVSGIQYKIRSTSGKKKTVVLYRVKNKKVKKASVPNTIKYKFVTYQVVEVSKNAFKGCRSLTQVTVGSKVTVIGSGAFSGCKKMKTITIRSKILKKIGKGAFAGISRKAKIKVPQSKVSQYRKLMKKG